MSLLDQITETIESHFINKYDNYNILEKNIPYDIIEFSSLTFAEFIRSFSQFITTLVDAKYLRLFDIDMIFLIESPELEIKTICIDIIPITPDNMKLQDTEEDKSNRIILNILNSLFNEIKATNRDRKILSFISQNRYNRHTLSSWFDFLNINKDVTPSIIPIYDLYGKAVKEYIDNKYNVNVFYPYNINELESGAYGSVYRISDNIVVKSFSLIRTVTQLLETPVDDSYIKEISMLSFMNNKSKYIIHYYENNASLISQYITMEYGGITLNKYMMKNEDISSDLLSNILFQILSGLQFLEVNKIIHRDIKPGNILIRTNNQNKCDIKIIDFGMSCIESNTSSEFMLVQTEPFRSPEIVALSGITSLKMDIWSVGIIFYQYITKDYTTDIIHRSQIEVGLSNTYMFGAISLLYFSIITNPVGLINKRYYTLWEKYNDDREFIEKYIELDDLNEILQNLYINNQSVSDIIYKEYDMIPETYDQIKLMIYDFLKQDSIHSKFDSKYADIFCVVMNKMLVFTEKDRYYASDILKDDLFISFANSNNLTSDNKLYNRYISDVLLFPFILLNERIIYKIVSVIMEFINNFGIDIHFGVLRLSFNLFYLSHKYMSNKQIKYEKLFLFSMCYILAHNYLDYDFLYINKMIDAKYFIYQIYIFEGSEYNFIFHDSRNKDEYLSDLGSNIISSLFNSIK